MKTFLALLLSLFCVSAFAQKQVTASITFTNLTTNGMTFTVNGNTRTFTNNPTLATVQVMTNSDATGCGSKTNLFNQIAVNPFSLVQPPSDLGSNNFSLTSVSTNPLVVTVVGNYAAVTYSTQAVSTATPVRMPLTIEPLSTQTNIANAMAVALNSSPNSTSLNQSAPIASQLLGTNKTQTVYGVTTMFNTNNQIYGIIVSLGISGNVSLFTNGIYYTPYLVNATETNDVHHGDSQIDQLELVEPGSGSTDNSFFLSNPSGKLIVTNTGDHGFFSFTSDGTFKISGELDVPVIVGSIQGDGSFITNINPSNIAGKIPNQLLTNSVFTNATFSGTNNFPQGSDISFSRFPITSLANGVNAAVPIGTNVFVEVSGPSADFAINGIANGRDGKLVIIVNQTGFNMTVAHQSGTDPTANNRIISMTGSDRITTGNGTATFIYSASAARWLLINFDP